LPRKSRSAARATDVMRWPRWPGATGVASRLRCSRKEPRRRSRACAAAALEQCVIVQLECLSPAPPPR
jgi:hypothetical protein